MLVVEFNNTDEFVTFPSVIKNKRFGTIQINVSFQWFLYSHNLALCVLVFSFKKFFTLLSIIVIMASFMSYFYL